MNSSADTLPLSKPRRVVLQLAREGALLGWLAACLYLLLALLSFSPQDPGWSTTGSNNIIENAAGTVGAWLANILFSLFGYLAYLFPLMMTHRISRLFIERHIDKYFDLLMLIIRFFGFALVVVSATGLVSMQLGNESTNLPFSYGGILGASIAEAVESTFGFIGATLLLLVMGLFGITIFTDLSWLRLMDWLGSVTLQLIFAVTEKISRYRQRYAEKQQAESMVKIRQQNLSQQFEKIADRISPVITLPAIHPEIGRKQQQKQQQHQQQKQQQHQQQKQQQQQQAQFDNSLAGELPPLSLLDQTDQTLKQGYSEESLESMSRLLELKLQDFSIVAEVVSVLPGPVVTRFEIQPAPGVKVNRITNLAKDLARSLAVISVRVVEVIPGKSVVGIEIPNEKRHVVRLSEVLAAPVYENASSPLTLALGHDISGEPVVADLAKMPHLLVAGTTGSGKSVGVNAMLLSLLYKSSPKEVRLLLVDPKMLELSVYEGIPHLLSPVITDMKDAANGLRWCVGEMERRYQLMAALGVRNLAGYNRKLEEAEKFGQPLNDPLFSPQEAFTAGETVAEAPKLESLPAIVVIIDEFADMMMVVGKKVEQLIARIAQKARAAGIHLILATQRPSVDVITGLIKANIPSRIAFQVSSKVDSRTILDQGGAEQLLGHGDMLYLPPGTSVPVRVHGAFVDDHEVHRVVENWKQRAKPNYIDGLVDEEVNAIPVPGLANESADGSDSESDSLYDEAVAFVTESRKASISSVQRKLRIGYNRAARLIETMEAAGVVSGMSHNGSREVLAPKPPRD